MDQEITKFLLETFFQETFSRTVDYFKENYKEKSKPTLEASKQIIEGQFNEVIIWCSKLMFMGLESKKIIDTETIPLVISNSLREYGSSLNKILTEENLIFDRQNYIVIADPGAGKTTTLKRLTWKFLFGSTNQSYKYPILVRLKEIKYDSLFHEIANKLGLPCEINEVKSRIEHSGKEYEIKIGNQLVQNSIPAFLESIQALLIIDGYDETEQHLKPYVKRDIQLLSRRSMNYKIILTTRYGEDYHSLENFNFAELNILDKSQIEAISNLWCDTPSLFLKELYEKPYHDLGNRPLFLNFLILHFNKLNYLPNDSYDAIDQIIKLLLDDWNKFQDVRRNSEYSKFYSSKKFKFLTELAYNITFDLKVKSFSHSDLVKVYNKIYYKYQLPKGEQFAQEVAYEIESHTGIIGKLHNNKYEFSHLVIQEYLSAVYIVKQPFSVRFIKLISIYPAILALATCISSENDRYFADLFLNTKFSSSDLVDSNNVLVYLTRLRNEKIQFNIGFELGTALMYLYFEYRNNSHITSLIEEFYLQESCQESIKLALENYYFNDIDAIYEIARLKRNLGLFISEDIKLPSIIALPLKYWHELNK